MSNYKFSLNPVKVKKVLTKNRIIQTSIPAPGTKNILKKLNLYESRSMHGQLPLVWHKAKNFSVFDKAGNKWIDFTSTIFVANVGHSNKMVNAAIKTVINAPLYSCYAYPNSLRAQYLEKLVKFAGKGFDKAFLLSAGTEATEAVFKLMRMHGQKIKKRKLGIICLEGNWHGRTLGAQMMSGNLEQKLWIGEKDKNIHHISFPYPWVLNNLSSEEFFEKSLLKLKKKNIDLKKDICGFMLETFQGWGAIFYPKDYVLYIKEFCKKNKILLSFDEMQAGFGRTGKNFGFQNYNVIPDLIACGKGMGGGLPLSGVIGKKEIMDLPSIGNMSSTHSANPMVCAAGAAVIDEIKKNDLLVEVIRKGKILHETLTIIKTKYPDFISFIFGEGLIAAIIFKKNTMVEDINTFTSKIAERCMQKGLLVVHTGRESIKIGPPLTITENALKEGLSVLDESINELINND